MSALSKKVVDEHATTLLAAYDGKRLLPTFSSADPSFELAQAYQVADEIRRRRIARGERPLGYKIGFTNRGIWQRYGVFAPIWGPVWDTTTERVEQLPGARGHGRARVDVLAQARSSARPPR